MASCHKDAHSISLVPVWTPATCSMLLPASSAMQKLFQHHAKSDDLTASLLLRTDAASSPLLCCLGLAWVVHSLAPAHWYPSGRACGGLHLTFGSWPLEHVREMIPSPCLTSLSNTQHIIPAINPAFNTTQVQWTPSRGCPLPNPAFLGRFT